MALTANTFYKVGQDRSVLALRVKDAEVIYAGAAIALGGPGHASAGYAFNFVADVTNTIFVGWALEAVTGDTSATEPPEVKLDIGGRLFENLAVSGLAGTIADVGKPVYMSDNGTFTVTAPTTGQERPLIGYITRAISATRVDVLSLSFAELLAQYYATTGEIPTA